MSAEAQRDLQRSLGPTAWAVLADLALDVATDGAGTAVVAISCRRVADQFGITKDTAARALRRLTAAGIIYRRPQETGPAGRFSPGTYELRLPGVARGAPCRVAHDTVGHPRPEAADTANADRTMSAATATGPARRPPRSTSAHGAGQLSLLDHLPGCAGESES